MILSFAARLTFFVMALALVGCDHATKHWAASSLKAARAIELVPGALDLRYAENTDVAFHLLRAIPEPAKFPIILSLGALATAALMIVWWRARNQSSLEHAAYALLVAGALGNLVDRVVRGYVVDFIHVHHWPIFNVADVCICVGAALLAWSTWRQARGARAPG
jgi:signal peptidase II